MSSVVYQIGKNGTKYAYESESYRDPITRKPRSKRTYLGRVDPDTGMIIPKAENGKRNRSKTGKYEGQLPSDFLQEMQQQKHQIADLQNELSALKKHSKECDALILQMKQLITDFEKMSEDK